MKSLLTFEAKCRHCGSSFSHPGLGDFAYGEAVLCSASGKSYATVDGLSETAERVRAMLDPVGAKDLWNALAHVADEIDGERLTASIHCPCCASTDLASWGGPVTGSRDVPEATFDTFTAGGR